MALGLQEVLDKRVRYALIEQDLALTPQAGAGSISIPFTQFPGFEPDIPSIQSDVSRSDLRTLLGEFESISARINPAGREMIGAFDLADSAVLRGQFENSADVGDADLGAITSISGQTITFTNSTVISGGFFTPGDGVTIVAGLDAADLNTNHIVVGVTANTVTLSRALTAATPASWSIRRQRTVRDGEHDCAFTIEEQTSEINGSIIGETCRFNAARWQTTKGQHIGRTHSAIIRRLIINPGADTLTNPTEIDSEPLAPINRRVIVNGGEVGKVVLCNIDMVRPTTLPETSTRNPEEVGIGALAITGQIGLLVSVTEERDRFINLERGFDIGFIFEQPKESGAPDFRSIYLSNCRYTNLRPSPAGRDGFRTITLDFEAGVDLSGGAQPRVMAALSVSNAA